MTETIQTNLFDVEEIYPNCTVQIWKNSVTGEASVGWWENDRAEAEKAMEVSEDA